MVLSHSVVQISVPVRIIVNKDVKSALATLNYHEFTPPIWRGLGRKGGRYGKRRVHKLRDAPSAVLDFQ
jgi:hypothetical protein